MRIRCLAFSSNRLPQSKLIGVSAMGALVSLRMNIQQNFAISIPLVAVTPPPPAPKERWSGDDIMEHLGAVRFRALVGEAKEMASAICEPYSLLTPVHLLINIGKPLSV